MKIFRTAILTLAVSIGSIAFSEAATEEGVEVKKDATTLRRKTQTECPSDWTIPDPTTGYPTYQCNLDCECTTPGTFKDDVGAAAGQPGCYRCSKSDNEPCTDNFECGLSVDCIQGTCNGNGGVGQCPNTQGPGGAPLCEPTKECECTENGFTLKENLGPTDAPCYHCSKPMGAACSDRNECSALDFNNNVICFEGVCSVQCPRGQGLCGDAACVCPTAEFPLQEEATPGSGCYRCVKPIGSECTHFSQCGEGSTCRDGVCTTELPTCNAYDNSGTYDFGGFVNQDDSNPPCQCDDPAYPNLLVIEFNSNSTIVVGGGNFGYICTDGSVPECPNSFTFNENGMAVRECQPNMLGGVPNPCDCTTGDYTAIEELLPSCFRCAKPEGTTCSEDAECLDGSHCDDTTSTCSSATQNCNSYDGGDYSFGVFWDRDCGGAPCVCGDPAYPNLETVQFDFDTGNVTPGGSSCGYVCAAQSGPDTPPPTAGPPSSTPNPTAGPPPGTPPPTASGLPDCNPYDPATDGGNIYFGKYTNDDPTNPPCGCSDSNFSNLCVADANYYYGYVCTPTPCSGAL